MLWLALLSCTYGTGVPLFAMGQSLCVLPISSWCFLQSSPPPVQKHAKVNWNHQFVNKCVNGECACDGLTLHSGLLPALHPYLQYQGRLQILMTEHKASRYGRWMDHRSLISPTHLSYANHNVTMSYFSCVSLFLLFWTKRHKISYPSLFKFLKRSHKALK